MASKPTGQFLAVMTMQYFSTKAQRVHVRSFGPYESRSGASGKIRTLRKEIAQAIAESGMPWDSTEPLRYNGIEYSFATSELWATTKS